MYTSVRFGVCFAVLLSLVFVAPAAAQQQLGAVNWTNLNNPVSNTNNANFGLVTSARPMRVVQLGAKWIF